MRTTFLPFSPPLIGDDEVAEVLDALLPDWITTGPKVSIIQSEELRRQVAAIPHELLAGVQ